jgi:hypothetical protein
MTTVRSTAGSPSVAASTNSSQATPVAAAKTPTSAKAVDSVGGVPASGAKAVIAAVKLDGGYVSGKSENDSYSVAGANAGGSLFNSAGNTAGAKKANGAGYERGAIKVSSSVVDDKHFAIDVLTMHSGSASLKGNDDGISLFLETKVQGLDAAGKPQEAIIRLATVHRGPANNVGPYDGKHRFIVSYQDLDKALKAHHPALSLFDKKGHFTGAGATVAIRAKWDGGHDWGGYGRLGVTEVPAPAARKSVVSIRNGAQVDAAAIAASDMPVDFEHYLPASVQAQFAAIFPAGKQVKVSTRLERELKGRVADVAQQEAAIVRMQLISAGYAPLVTRLKADLIGQLQAKAGMSAKDAAKFANDIHIQPHTEWAQKDSSGAFTESKRLASYKTDPQKLIAAGLAADAKEAKAIMSFIAAKGIVFHDPLPLEDKYQGKKSEMARSVIRRVRSNDIAEGVYNVKPGPGKLQSDIDATTASEPCGLIRMRVEASVDLASKKVDRKEVEKFEQSDQSTFNVFGSLLEEAGVYVPGNYQRYADAPGTDPTLIAFTMMQERHRFDIEIDGMKLDTSIDFVEVDETAKGGKKATRQIVEMELEHKFISPPTAGGAAAGTAAAPAIALKPSLHKNFKSLDEQKKQVSTFKSPSLNVPPRFHRLKDLEDKALWLTSEQLVSNAVTNAFIGVLYPGGIGPCEQKGVELAKAIGKL